MQKMFQCPHCGVKLRVSEDKLGKKLRCPKCKQSVQTPEPDPVFLPPDPDPLSEEESDAFHYQVPVNEDHEAPDQNPVDSDWEDEDFEDIPPALPIGKKRLTSPYSRPMRGNRFWLLRFLTSFGYVIGVIIFGVSVLLGLFSIGIGYHREETFLSSLFSGLVQIGAGAMVVLPLIIWVQLIDCFLAIEENTRRAVDR